MSGNVSIDYLEFLSSDFEASKAFFGNVFNWTFTSYGENYLAFHGAGIDGGFALSESKMTAEGGALVVFLSDDLAATEKNIRDHGGTISTPVFSFPGGSRFHFKDPTGNEFAVWKKS